MNISQPIIKKIEDTRNALDFFEKEILLLEDKKTQKIIKNFPTVYIHNWKNFGKFEVYIGESNNIFRRTREHFDMAENNTEGWQRKLLNKKASLFIIGHEHFNKSLTLDIENRLMNYMLSVDSVKSVHNSRANPQFDYYPVEELDEIFNKIWMQLHKENEKLFPTESFVQNSAIYKASPLHKLTEDQKKAKEIIIQKVDEALSSEKTEQLIFIDGEAGTGKTVLNSSTFYELYCQAEKAKKKKSSLSRVIATYDWEYSSIHEPKDRWLKYWEVMVGKWHKPWNRELEKNFSKEEKKQIKGLAWAEQPQTIDEVGSTYTIQGFDLNYAGVILGPSVKYRNGEIIFDPTESHNHKATRNRTLGDGSKQKFGELLIQHEVRVLMTRGVNGVYIYACDEQLREALNKAEG